LYRKLIKIISEKDLFIFSLIIIILGAAGFIFVNDLENVIDIKWHDEGYYLYGGRFFFSEKLSCMVWESFTPYGTGYYIYSKAIRCHSII
jgi:hypothetical protein